ncbi:hypothetical protein NP493_584g03012 [Ridgeia piscesae]|uniref:Uncharacterized protein n=1 Tax=Ridgeia piscesae TaxID=27915 RepID=A0AAD9KU59_RIDPI|nr:hypothetical protein NP493_584g03012 [Ridgeia piscesae]
MNRVHGRDHLDNISDDFVAVAVEKTKPLFQPSIKRTNSLDAIASSWYLKSEWPRLTSEKSTQTEDDWEGPTDRRKRVSHKRSSSLGNGDNSKELQKFKARLAKTTKEGSRPNVVVAPRANTLPTSHLAVISTPVAVTTLHRSKALPVPHIPKPAARVIGSVEGLNQEIEKLVLSSTTSATGGEEIGSTRTQEPTPDGHRAPILELLQGGSTGGSSSISSTRTVVTQTPSGSNSGGGGGDICVNDMKTLIRLTVDSSGSNSSSRSQSESPSPDFIPGLMDNSRPSSSRSESVESKEDRTEKDRDSSLLFVREPPDGCDKVIVEEPRMALECEPFAFCPIKKPEIQKCRIPSNESAFRTCPLYDKYLSQSTEMALTAVSPGGKPGSSPPALEIQ